MEQFATQEGLLTPVAQEQLLNSDGSVNMQHLHELVGGPKPLEQVYKTFGTVNFSVEKQKNELSLEEFQYHYEFGKYPNVRHWITEMYELTGKLLTREKLFEFITSSDGSAHFNRTHKAKRRNCVFY